jgi:hypothetical protein
MLNAHKIDTMLKERNKIFLLKTGFEPTTLPPSQQNGLGEESGVYKFDPCHYKNTGFKNLPDLFFFF